MDEYSHNIVSDIAREYKNTETDLITVEKNFHNTPQLSLSDYVFYDYIKKELATTKRVSNYYAQYRI